MFLSPDGSGGYRLPPIPADYSVYTYLDRVENLAGETCAVEAFSLWGNDHVAVANEVSGLPIYQINGGDMVPVGVGPATGSERDVAVVDWNAYVATGNRLGIINEGHFEILDIADPAAIAATDTLPLNDPYYLCGGAGWPIWARGSDGPVPIGFLGRGRFGRQGPSFGGLSGTVNDLGGDGFPENRPGPLEPESETPK